MQTLALIVVVAFSLWVLGIAASIGLRPRLFLHLIELMTAQLAASNWKPNLAEQSLRVIVGLALLIRSPQSKVPWLLEAGGWMLVASSLLILALPLRWHAAFGFWLTRKLTLRKVRLMAPLAAFIGAGLLYAAV